MASARDFLDLIRPDHEFMLMLREPDQNMELNMVQVVELHCSCKWTVYRAVSENEILGGYSSSLTQAWTDRMTLEHLLDQELNPVSVVETMEVKS